MQIDIFLQVLQADGDGNGFKTSTMRLGADVIVFSRCSGKDGKSSTQSIGLLSYTFLTSTGKEDIVVPMLDYERIDSEWCPIIRSSVGDWEKNVETVVQWSPYTSQEDLLRQFNLMRAHGTKIIIYNLWEDDENLILTLILMISNLEGSIETRKISIWLLNILTLDTIKHETVCNFRPYNCSSTGSECSVMGDISFLVDHLSDLGIREYTYLFGKHLQKDSLMEISQTSRIHLLLSLPVRKGQRMYPHITDLAYLLDTIKTIIQVGSEAF